MVSKRKYARFVCAAIALMLIFSSVAAFAAPSLNISQPRYSKIMDIDATLSISGNVATCKGYVKPENDYNCTVTVTLYKQSGTKWSKVIAWSKTATGGNKASVSQTYNLTSHGSYKVVTTGSVGGESSRVESSTCTY